MMESGGGEQLIAGTENEMGTKKDGGNEKKGRKVRENRVLTLMMLGKNSSCYYKSAVSMFA